MLDLMILPAILSNLFICQFHTYGETHINPKSRYTVRIGVFFILDAFSDYSIGLTVAGNGYLGGFVSSFFRRRRSAHISAISETGWNMLLAMPTAKKELPKEV